MTRWLVSSGIAFSLLVGCGGSDEPGTPTTAPGAPTTGGPAAGTVGAAGAATGAAGRSGAGATGAAGTPNTGTNRPPTGAAGTPSTPPAGAAGTPAGAAGATAAAGTSAGAAGGGAAGEPAAAGSGGDAAAAGAGGDSGGAAGDAAPPASGDAFAIRGDDPTEQSANGETMGPYAVESYTSGYARGDFSDATMWYPTSPEAKPPFGCVAVVPGFVSPQSSIRNWGPFLASNGIVAITIGVPGSDQPSQRAMSLMSALETCVGENDRADSPIKGKISKDHLGLSGWSMGGGGTLIAASRNPNIKAAVSFAAWGPTGGGMNTVPVLMFEATADVLAASMSDGYYRQTPETTPKMLFEVQGSSHNVANDPANHNGIIGLYGLSWFKVFLEGDERYRKFLTAGKPDICTDKYATNVK